MIEQMVRRYGAPLALYHDRHTMFPARRSDVHEENSIQEQLQATVTQTQLGRLFTQLGVTSIAARSPQAKGRIERLWGTFQDRLVSELRLANAQTIEEANSVLQEYLPRFNARFAVPAAQKAKAWQELSPSLSLHDCFSLQEERVVSHDNTISSHGRRIQLLPVKERSSWVRCRVMVQEQFDGAVSIVFEKQHIPSREAPCDPAQQRRPATPSAPVSAEAKAASAKARIPKVNHPWRKPHSVSSS